MREVLYNRDLEPITVFHFKPYFYQYIALNGVVRVPVYKMHLGRAISESEGIPRCPDNHIVTIEPFRFNFYGKIKCIYVTADEESALLLESVFLPGQLRALNEIKKEQFANGFRDAFSKFIDFGD
jgi:hypothetical protein